MGLSEELSKFHRYEGLRATGMGRELELEVAGAPDLPDLRLRRARRELDQFVAANARPAGAGHQCGHAPHDGQVR